LRVFREKQSALVGFEGSGRSGGLRRIEGRTPPKRVESLGRPNLLKQVMPNLEIRIELNSISSLKIAKREERGIE
jgi:hypothetical protein